jgi:hypothetical protein
VAKKLLQVGYILCYWLNEKHDVIDIETCSHLDWVSPNWSKLALLSSHVQHLPEGIHGKNEKHWSYRSPLACLIGCPGSPFSMILEVVVLQISDIISLHLGSNPRCCITSSRYSHLILSNSFAMSSLRRSMGVFALWKWFSTALTYWKLSWMVLPLMKALWLWETSLSMCWANLVAGILARILAVL